MPFAQSCHYACCLTGAEWAHRWPTDTLCQVRHFYITNSPRVILIRASLRMQQTGCSAAFSVMFNRSSIRGGATQKLSNNSSSGRSSCSWTSASWIHYCSCNGTLSGTLTSKALSSHLAAGKKCGGHVTSVQMAILTSGKLQYTTDHADPAAPSVQAEQSVHTTVSPPRLLKLQPNGVQATRAPHMTSWFSAAREGVGNALMVMSGKQGSLTGPCFTEVAPIVRTSHKGTGKSSATQL